MGNLFSCQCSGDAVLDRITRCLSDKGYIRNLKKNLRALEREMEDLRAIKDEVQNKVAREETRHQQRLKAVQVWLDRVDSIDIKCKDLLSIGPVERQKLCLCGLCLCSKNVFSSYKYGKRVFLLLEEVRTLKSEGKFDEVAQPPPRSEFEERPTQHTIGHEEMLAKTWNRLMEDGVGIMGLHGMGGVGKTTLFKKIHNKFDEIPGTFDVVIWIVVSQGATTSKLQEDIAAKLLLCGDEWTNTNEDDKAAKINTFLKRKKFVLMLDDIWEEVDLVEAIGIPFPTRENGCKVAFTTRSQEVCGKMGDHEAMEIKCLKRDEAWELFKTKVGDNTLSRDPGIVKLARWVADKCGGLPLAINVIGKAMASKNIVQEWEHAIDVLTRSAAEFSEMKNKILPVLKFSYDSLGDQQLQSCFLYCALFPEDHQIPKEELLRLWMCEGFLGEYQVIKEVYNKGYAMLGTLIRANLITEVGTEFVVMHDVVREMALWIASDFGKQKETFVVRARVGLLKIPEVKDWGAVRRMSLMNNNIEEITCSSNCCELTTLFLQGNRLKNISGEFLQSMKKLVVLDLSNNIYLSELPEQISELASLQYLDLSFTSIEKLPAGFQELKKLTYIGLFSTKKLCSISGISKLLSLRLLNLVNSNVHGDVSLLKELQLLKNLQGLRITVSAELSLEHILGNQRLANCITSMDIIDFQEKPLQSIENLRSLTVESSHVSEINNLTIPCFTNLSELYITECHSMKDLTWLLFTPNLVFLVITHSREVEEIINKEKATNFKGIIPFQKLEKLIVGDLPKLESICWSPLPFPFLRWILVRDCPKLRKLPLNATSVPLLDEHGSGIHMLPPKQINDLEWEDDDTKNRFLASINRIQYYSGLGTL